MSTDDPVIVVGAGLAGDTAAAALREHGWVGRVVLIGDEPEAPYDRPPLSKDALTGELPPERLFLRAAGWYQEQDIDLRLGVPVAAIDRAVRRVSMADGSSLPYHRLLIATGARARTLPPAPGGPPMFVIRTLADAQTLRGRLCPGTRVAVVGAGVIGLEAAASARALGCHVAVVELADRVMARVAPPAISAFLEERHRAEGVELHLSAGSVTLTATGVQTESAVVTADVVVVGIGVRPNTELAEAAGLECSDGIVVDAVARTSDPAIFAAGDVARYPDPFGRGLRRCENWKHAQSHALTAVRAMLGVEEPYAVAPSMWSDQFGLKFQTVGRLEGTEVARGTVGGPKFMTLYLDDAGTVVGALGVNMAKDMRFAAALVEQRRHVDPARLADPTCDLRKL